MKETDPLEYDKLGVEIWQVLREQERFSDSRRQTVSSAPRLTCSPQGQAAKTHDDFFDVMTSLRTIWVTQANLRNQAISRFDCWSLSVTAMFQHSSVP
jgi:hypothetical protein